jgi:soluble lytic murein transglycosylase-like protein
MGAIGTASLTSELADSNYTDEEILKALGQEEPVQPVKPIPSEKQEIKVGKQNISIPTGEGFAPVNLVKAVMQVESAGNPYAVSSKGASGLMQLMPATAKMLGVDPSDPQQNVEGGSKYLQQQINAFDDVKLGLAAYNWGPGSIRSAISDAKSNDWETIVKRLGVKYKQNSKIKERAGAPKNSRYGVPEETYLYVTKVLNNLEKLNNLVEA